MSSFPPFTPPRNHDNPQPYLGPKAHQSQSLLTQPFLSLILLLASLSLLVQSVPFLVRDAKLVFSAACRGTEDSAGTMASLPHFVADGVNRANRDLVDDVVAKARETIDFLLVALEAVAVFIVDLYKSLFLCLLDLVIHGSLSLLIAGVQEAEEFVTSLFQGVRTDVQDAIEGVNSALNSSVAVLDKIPGVNLKAPQIDVPTLSSLENVTIPSTFVTSLESLNSSIPTLSQLRTTVNNLISTPIESLRATVNATMSNSTLSIEQLPVPARETVQFCDGADLSWIDDVGHVLSRTAKVGIAIVVASMVVLALASWFWEKYRYNSMLASVERARSLWLSLDHNNSSSSSRNDDGSGGGEKAYPQQHQQQFSRQNLLAFISATEHPILALVVARLASSLRLAPRSTANLHWFAAYVFSPAALVFLLIGLVGLVSVAVQLVVIDGPVRTLANDRARRGADGFASDVAGLVARRMNASSAEFAAGSNKVILGVQDGVNNNVFGWVNTTTTAMNSTINGFYEDITNAITGVFNGTVLENPALDLVFCLIGSKVEGISKALTFIHDHAHLSLPTVSPTIFVLSPNRTSELTDSLTSPNSTVSTTSVVNSLIDKYAASLRSQRTGFVICLAVWGFILLMGLIGVWWKSGGEERWRNRKGRRPVGGLAPFAMDARRHDLGADRGNTFHLSRIQPTSSHSPTRSQTAIEQSSAPVRGGPSLISSNSKRLQSQ
ncbi:hypothetical protein T439DRAFT_169746 [Meredithblackwellia eburnea MCA 4105]